MPLSLQIKSTVSRDLKEIVDFMPDVIARAGNELVGIVVRRSVNEFMRDARNEDRRRSPVDGGPLRIVSGRLANSLLDARGDSRNAESIYQVEQDGRAVTIRFGSRVPYAAIQEFGGVTGRGQTAVIPGRPYLGPALIEATNDVVNALDFRLQQFIDQVVA